MRRLLFLVIGTFGMMTVGCATDQQVISQAVETHKQLEPAVLEDQQLNDYITKIGRRIQAVAKDVEAQGDAPSKHKKDGDTSWMYSDKVQFHIVNSDTLNAFTTGGYHVYIYSELFETCKDEDEFAAVVAHEYAHIYCRHVQKGMDKQTGVGLIATAAQIAGGAAENDLVASATGLVPTAGQLLVLGWTRGDEDEADKYGFRFYTRAGWNPDEFAGFFKTMIAKGYDTTPELASNHPTLKNRVENTERRISELPDNYKQWRRKDIVTQAEFKALQSRSARVGKSAPNDKSLAKAQLMLAAFPSCVAPVAQPEQRKAKQTLLRDAQHQDSTNHKSQ